MSASARDPHRPVERLRRALRHSRQLLMRALSEFFGDGAPQVAAGISYYGLLALFPLAILTAVLFGLFLGDDEARERVVSFVLDRVPLTEDQGRTELSDALGAVTGNATAFGIVGLAVLAFAASGLMSSIRNGLNHAWDVTDQRPPLRGKLYDLVLVLGVGLVIGLSIGLTFVSRVAVSLGDTLGDSLGAVGSLVPRLLLTLGQLTPIAVSFAVFAFLFRVLPAAEVRLRDVWPGALLAALGFELLKTGFSFYLENFARYGAIYGSLGFVVAFLVFMFLAANVMLLGAEAASEWPRVRSGEQDRREAEEPDRPLGERLRSFARGLVRED